MTHERQRKNQGSIKWNENERGEKNKDKNSFLQKLTRDIKNAGGIIYIK